MHYIINMINRIQGIFLGLLFLITMPSFACKKKEVETQFTVSSSQVVFEPEGSNSDVSITGNVNWTATANTSLPWLTINQSSGGPGNVTLKLTANANNTGATRGAIVTITASNGNARRIQVTQPINEDLEAKWAKVSPKLLTNNANPLLDFMFTADPTAVEYNGRIYVYATNDHEQYEHVGKGWEKFIRAYPFTGHDVFR
jgi:hypothetical protein